ncbi:MAG: 16S rRNA (guanine(527)-N(7))-methyltransferase RsmG [Bdellovibrionales bacterium]|nr:16S rRNA (guanine(527)-N(7))-methyltransferase RsmG [Bdellovibrionales bacterium]
MKRKDTHKKPEKIFSFEEADSRLYDLFRHHGFEDFPHAERRRLVEFYLLLMNHQLRDNVTRLVKFRDIAIKHFIDSLIVPRLTTLKFPLLDVGTGPGFPGIPLKILFPKEKIVLAEGVRRRVDFLKAVREDMKLTDLQIVGRKIDDQFQLPMKGVITRALEDVGATLKNISQCLEVDGHVYFMKGPNVDPEIKAAGLQWGEYFELIEDHKYELPNTPNLRRLVVFRKIKTPALPEHGE